MREAVDGRLDHDEAGDSPSAESVKRWGHWLMANRLDIEGYVKSVAHRELEFSEELLKSGVSLLELMRSRMPGGWLQTVIRIIYNAGGFLRPLYC